MKNMQTLALLIDRAESERDKQQQRTQALHQTVCESRGMLSRLEGFRSEFITRSPGTDGPSVDATHLDSRASFLGALGNAIGSQRSVCAERARAETAANAQLAEQQRRLLALQALHSRRTHAEMAMQIRRDQHESDAWAARASRTTVARKST
ncbi:MAG TPA: flagellar FliJ family protein [Burkholderiaceae bacterium]